jgi:cellobiose-specific phosphotransferase system component IIA
MNEAAKTLTGSAKMHLDAAISALQSGDTNGATMHIQESQKNL